MKLHYLILIVAMFWLASPSFAQETTVTSSDLIQKDRAEGNDPSKPLSPEIISKFKAIRSDPDPDQLVRDAHYWVSNENAHYVWYPHIQNLGGLMSGVGTDQLYLLAGWSRPAILVPLDFDRQIRDLHFAYGAAFLEAENIEAFLSFWGKDGANKMKTAVEKHFPERAKDVLAAYKTARSTVQGRLRRYTRSPEYKTTPSFMTDEQNYQFVRSLWQNQRVFPICGDLTGNNAMLDLAKSAKESGLKLSLLYLSNAEHYFPYGPEYRRNIIAQDFADNGLVLRTRQMSSLGLAAEGDYHYNMQSGANFKLWMETTRIGDQHKMLRKRSKSSQKGLSILDHQPEPSKEAPQIAPLP